MSLAVLEGLQSMTLLVLLMPCVSLTQAGGLYRIYQGYDLQPCPMTSLHWAHTKSRCVSKCSQTVGCVAGTYQEDSGQCCLSDSYIYTTGLCGVSQANTVYFQQEQDHAYTGSQWLLAFRATSGNGESVYVAWYNNGTYHDFPVGGDSSTPITCWSTSASCSCPHHLRSKLLDLWQEGSINPQRVKYAMYKSGAEVANIVFNGVDSDLTTWFDRSRINSSTFSDVTTTQTYNHFSIYGFITHTHGKAIRRFYVNNYARHCGADGGWTMVVEGVSCPYESLGDLPLFMYAPNGELFNWGDSDDGVADVMAIFLQL